jgi:hypothetical protein
VSRHLSIGLGWGGVVVLAMVLAGCSTAGQPDSTAAIAGPSPANVANGMNSANGAVMANTGQPAGIGGAVTLADATCDQLKAELATFDGDKIPEKLADFGKAKYHPTAEESIRFARYVDVSKASKDKNCAVAKVMKKKPVVAARTPVDPATKKLAGATPANPTAVQAVPVAKARLPATPAIQPDEGVTVQVPDSSG